MQEVRGDGLRGKVEMLEPGSELAQILGRLDLPGVAAVEVGEVREGELQVKAHVKKGAARVKPRGWRRARRKRRKEAKRSRRHNG